MKKRNWGIAVALVVALLLGGVIGVAVEHERLLDKLNQVPSVVPEQTLADWFKGSDPTTCTPVRAWSAAASAAYVALGQGTSNWNAARTTMLEQNAAGTAALRSLLSQVTPTGAAEIQSLIGYQDEVRAALQDATSVNQYSGSLTSLDSERTTRNLAILAQAAQLCGPG